MYLGDREVAIGFDPNTTTEEGKSVQQVHLLADCRISAHVAQSQVAADAEGQHGKGSGHADLSAADDRHLGVPGHDLR